MGDNIKISYQKIGIECKG